VFASWPRSPIAKSAHDPAAVVIEDSSGAYIAVDDAVKAASLLALAVVASTAVTPTVTSINACSQRPLGHCHPREIAALTIPPIRCESHWL
jgi:hypothetical protein